MVTKIIKNSPLCILLPKYKRYFDRTKYTYFMIKVGKKMEVLEKVITGNIVNKINGELIHNKKYKKLEKLLDTNHYSDFPPKGQIFFNSEQDLG